MYSVIIDQCNSKLKKNCALNVKLHKILVIKLLIGYIDIIQLIFRSRDVENRSENETLSRQCCSGLCIDLLR